MKYLRKSDIVSGRRLIQMPLTPQTKEKKYGYDQSYLRQNIVQVGITFNRRKPDDMKLIEWINSRKESKVSYVKRLIREDMERGSK